MKTFRADVEDFLESVKKLLTLHQQNEVKPSVIFKDYTLSLVDSTSEEIREILGSDHNFWKEGKVILVQEDDISKGLGKNNSSLMDEFQDDAERSYVSRRSDADPDECKTCWPVSLDKARYLLSLHNICNNPHLASLRGTDEGADDALPDMVVYCDGKDRDHTAVMACSANKRARSAEGKGQRSPGMSVTTVSCFGPVMSKSSLLTVDQVIQQSGGLQHKDNVTTSALALYEIVGMTYHETSVLDPASHSHCTSVTMDCSWEHVKAILEKPHSAKCNVHVRAVPGDMRSAAYSVYKELSTLVGFVQGLETEELEWNMEESSSESLEVAVTRLIEKEKQGPQRKPELQVQTPLENSDTDFDSLLRGYVIPERQDLYFSESLWTILWSKATCYDDVIKAFSVVFRELKTGELQPIVHSDNQSILAKAIRASYQQQMHTVSVDEVAILTMLVEIGLDKLRRDYTNFFIASELTTLNQLQWYLESGDACSLAEQAARLQALHNVLEVAVVSVTSLKLPPEHRRALVRSGLSYFQSHPHDDIHTFSLPVEAATVQSLYTSYQPSLWRLTVKGSSGTSSSYQLSMKPPMSHIHGLDPDISVGDLTCAGSFCYYVAHTQESKASFV
ncbi:protein zwilch homolog [Acanthaster planci]|uniref:Protein zwilch n=1 Tax=Acanthaster planci TaxID=133434 RepID=A0A8B7XY45_ACAPL|nr:protein zwilch homolog [Acanthaster planci]